MDTVSLSAADFDDASWHDCHVWGMSIGAGDPDTGDWASDLALDLDFIVEWICGVNQNSSSGSRRRRSYFTASPTFASA